MELYGRAHPDEIIVVGAHYDSLRGTPGANDNGSGIAALLELARLAAQKPIQKTIRFVAFVNEEPPFFQTENMGSWVYARRARQRNENISAMFSLETIGAYYQEKGSQRYPFPFGTSYPDTGDFIAFVSNLSSRRLVKKCIATFRKNATLPSEGIAAPQWMMGIAWSDQWAFWKENYPAVMVTDTAPFRYKYYHTAHDTVDKLDYESFTRAVAGLSFVLDDLSKLQY
jgi:Zn-dependent M28 family amino/carboxypeptidase